MTPPLAPMSSLLAAGPATPATVEALKDTLAALRAARGGPKAVAAAPAPVQGPPLPPDFGRELARTAAAKPAPPAASPDTIPPEILPLLFDGGAFAPGKALRLSDIPDEETMGPPMPAPAPAAAASEGPIDLGRFRGEAASPARPETTASARPAAPPAAAAEEPGKPVEVDVDRLAKAPSNFLPLDVLQAMKARHAGAAAIRAEAPTKPEPRPVSPHAR